MYVDGVDFSTLCFLGACVEARTYCVCTSVRLCVSPFGSVYGSACVSISVARVCAFARVCTGERVFACTRVCLSTPLRVCLSVWTGSC